MTAPKGWHPATDYESITDPAFRPFEFKMNPRDGRLWWEMRCPACKPAPGREHDRWREHYLWKATHLGKLRSRAIDHILTRHARVTLEP